MIFAILGLLFLAATILPQIWVKRVMTQYDGPDYRYETSGGELARILLNRYGLNHVKLEITPEGDHYDPRDQTVRLSESNHSGHSLTAITIAAHEVGHAIQDDTGYQPMVLRSKLVGKTQSAERLGAMILMASPVIAILSRRPLPALILFLAGLISMGAPVAVHLATLPVEFDASFNRALPILKAGHHIKESDQQAAHQILKAAAWTYVAGSLGSLLNFWKWLKVIRR
jgi:hypothetical protein